MLFKKQLLSGFIIVLFLLITSIDEQWFKLGSKIKISQKIRNKNNKLNADDVSEHNYRFDQREVAYRMNFGWSAELPDEVDVIGDDDLIM